MAKEKPKSLDNLLEDADSLKEKFANQEETHLYMPDHNSLEEKHRNLVDYAEECWDKMQPHSASQAVASIAVNPGIYMLWKLPAEMHDYLDKTLGYATYVLARTAPEAALATGLTYGISEVMLAMKEQSGKRLVSGLIGLLTHLKKAPNQKFQNFSNNIMASLKNYFNKRATKSLQPS